MSEDALVRAPLGRIVRSRERITILGADGVVRAFDGDSAVLIETILELLDEPLTWPALVEGLRSHFDEVDERLDLIRDAVKHLRTSGVIGPVVKLAEKQPGPLWGLRVVVAATGAIANAHTPLLVNGLLAQGASVRVALSRAARRFLEPRLMEALTHQRVETSMWASETIAPHIDLAEWADAILVVPATATTLSRVARGDCSDLISALCIATRAPVLFMPSMNNKMLTAPAVQRNREQLRQDGFHIADAGTGAEVASPPNKRVLSRGPMLPHAELMSLVNDWLRLNASLPELSSPRYWNAMFTRPEEELPWASTTLEPALHALLDGAAPQRVLDIGTGLGTVATIAARLGHHVTATDVSTEAIARASERSSKVSWLEDDVTASKLRGKFDVVIDRAVLHTLAPSIHAAYARQIQAWLAPQGRFAVVTHTHEADASIRTFRFTEEMLVKLFEPLALTASETIQMLGRSPQPARVSIFTAAR